MPRSRKPHPLYASVPQLGVGYSVRFSDQSTLTGYGPIPNAYAGIPVIRFDKSWNDHCREWVRAVFAAVIDERSLDAVEKAREIGLCVEG
jgi:hypothetical protein